MHIFDLFDKAKQTLKWPKIYYPHENQMIVFSMAGPNASMPGSINITDGGKYANNKFYGRIIKDNAARKLRFQWNEHNSLGMIIPKDIIKAIVTNPIGLCSLVGQKFSYCCFCGTELTNKESIFLGYGPICADNWGLPHGGLFEAEERKKLGENL